VWLGVGGLCNVLSDFPRSYREAQLALRIRETVADARRVLFFDQLGAYRLLAELGDPGAIDRFVGEWLGTLISYDSDHRTDLVTTLGTYLERRGNHKVTATALSVHRNTLNYRMRRVAEISGHDLEDPNTLFNLQLATRALWTRKALAFSDTSAIDADSA
jgi:DNA-binding PucR family transcriptional regulator